MHKLFIGDHNLVSCVRKFEGAIKKNSKIVQTRSMKNFDKDAFLNDVAVLYWQQGLNETDDVDILVAHCSSMFSSIIDNHASINFIRVSERYCPWVNRNMKKLMQSEDTIKKAAIKNKPPLLISSYRNIRNETNRLDSELKKKLFGRNISNQRQHYGIIEANQPSY